MASLIFSPNADDSHFDAQFFSGSSNVVQVQFPVRTSPGPRTLSVSLRVDDTLDWTVIKTFSNPPDNFVFSLDIPEDLPVLLTANDEITKAVVLA